MKRIYTVLSLISVFLVALFLLFSYGNPQWNKYVYMWQMYLKSESDIIWIQQPDDFDGVWRTWNSEGELQSEICWQNGMRQGRGVIVNADTVLQDAIFFDNGKRWNDDWKFRGNGMYVTFSFNYEDDKLHGVNTSYFENGQIGTITTFDQGLIDGVWVKYDEEGRRLMACTFEKGHAKGLWITYEPNMNIVSTIDWWGGEGISAKEIWNVNGSKPNNNMVLIYDVSEGVDLREKYIKQIQEFEVKLRDFENKNGLSVANVSALDGVKVLEGAN